MTKSSLPAEVDSRVSSGSLLAAGIIVAAFSCVGVAVSAAWYAVTPKVFESFATVLIEPRLRPPAHTGRIFDYRHDQLIGEDNIIIQVLIKYDLKGLVTLRDLIPAEQIQHIQQNLEIQQSEETDNLYHLRFRSGNATDAQTVLATLVSAYEKYLIEKYQYVSSDTLELLGRMKKSFEDDLASKAIETDRLEKRIARGQTRGDPQAKLRELQENIERLQTKLDRASRQFKFHLSEEARQAQRGFKFTTLSPADRGVAIYPRLPVILLIGGGVGALIGLIFAGLLHSVLGNRR